MGAALASFGAAVGAILSQTSIVKSKVNEASNLMKTKIDGITDKAKNLPTTMVNAFKSKVDTEINKNVATELRKPLPAGTPGAYIWNETWTGTNTGPAPATRTQTGTFTTGSG